MEIDGICYRLVPAADAAACEATLDDEPHPPLPQMNRWNQRQWHEFQYRWWKWLDRKLTACSWR